MTRSAIAPMVACLAVLMAHQATAQSAAPAWRLVEEWTVGGEADGPLSFDYTTRVQRLPSGNLVHLNARASRLHFLDAQGRPIRSVGQVGRGPNDLYYANGILVARSGEVVVNDAGNGRLSFWSATGVFQRTVRLTDHRAGNLAWDAIILRDGRLVERIDRPARPEQPFDLIRWSRDLKQPDTLRSTPCGRPGPIAAGRFEVLRRPDGSAPYLYPIPLASPSFPTALDPAGFIWEESETHPGEIVRRPLDGCSVAATVRLAKPPKAIDGKLRAEITAEMEAFAKHQGRVPPKSGAPTVYPWYDSLVVDSEGNLWVNRRNAVGAVEVYAPGGKLIASFPTPLPVSFMRYPLVTADHIYGFRADDDGVAYLVSVRIEKK